MVVRNRDISLLEKLLREAEQDLMTPQKFHARCQAIRQQGAGERLYFYEPPADWSDRENGPSVRQWQQFFDELAIEIGQAPQNARSRSCNLGRGQNPLKIEVEIVGEGMVGRVARVRINEEKSVAFKAFFDPEFVWQHGARAEIPIGIWLKGHQGVKDLPEFLFAGEDWAVWEWISPQTQPQLRPGIPYDELAQQYGLTRLNPLNRQNYNLHNLRLDPGGIQKEYFGRRLRDGILSCVFYWRKVRREGWHSIALLLTRDRLDSSFGQFLGLFGLYSRTKLLSQHAIAPHVVRADRAVALDPKISKG